MRSKPQDTGVTRRVVGVVNGAGTIFSGTGFTVTKTGTGAYQVRFTESFRALISVAGNSPSGQLSYSVAFGSLAPDGFMAYGFTTNTNAVTDTGFTFIAEGLAR